MVVSLVRMGGRCLHRLTMRPSFFVLLSIGAMASFLLSLTLLHSSLAWVGICGSVVAVGLLFENVVVASGFSLHRAGKLLPLSRARYQLHAVGAPLLLPMSLQISRHGGLEIPLYLNLLFYGLAVLWILFGLVRATGERLNLVLCHQGRLLRHIDGGVTGFAAFHLLLVALVIAIFVLGVCTPNPSVGWPMAIGALVMFLGAAAAPSAGLAASNVSELLFLMLLLLAAPQASY
jgi:hypothetical protein